ncbi:MAG TPA: pyridoxamine 5'-phosphate oxidase family protein [Acidimicrobiia bacterium]|nr:pyridoxamine 5'-phosphate oxidase family protein [Acidimicrobiia bacterium]
MAGSVDRRGLRVLTLAECEDLLAQGKIGRIGLQVAGETLVLPVLYCFVEGTVAFRTAPGEKLDSAWVKAPASFEIDDWDLGQRTGWSVLVKGRFEEVSDPGEIAALEEVGLESWTPEVSHTTWVRITPTSITGRRIVPQLF